MIEISKITILNFRVLELPLEELHEIIKLTKVNHE